MIQTERQDGVCLLRFDAPPLNTLTFELLKELTAAVAEAVEDRSVRGLAIAGNERHFRAGADIHLFQEIATPEDAIRVLCAFQEAFDRLEQCPKPIVAAVAGHVLGGALEMVLACHYRLAAAGTRFSMPEVKLGINPGAGGTQRLPRLVGAPLALQMLLSARSCGAEEALAAGLVDRLVPGPQLLEEARHFARQALAPRRTCDPREVRPREDGLEAALARAKAELDDAHAELVAPRKIYQLVRVSFEQSLDAGLLQEQTAFAECMQTRATQNMIRLFFATREVGKISELSGVQPAACDPIGVVGLGTMGTGISQALLQGGYHVVALDQDESQLRRGEEQIARSLGRRVEDGKLDAARAEQLIAKLTTTGQWSELSDCPLILESVFEDEEVKRGVLQQLESVCAADTILASNTSTFSLDDLAEEMRHPDRLIGMHFFNPAPRMPLVEIVRRANTPPVALATALQVVKSLRKTPVVVANREGFLVDRLFVPYLQEAFALLEEGVRPEDVDLAAIAFGFPMGPLILIDMAGLDILVHSQRVLQRAFPCHGELSPIAIRLVERGHVGQKSGAGVYRYEPGSRVPHPHTVTGALIEQVRHKTSHSRQVPDQQEVINRLVLRMVNEAFYAMEEGLARCDTDVDVATVLGIGFPNFRGGVVKYALDIGLHTILRQLETMAKQYGPRYAPCRLLRERKGVS